MRLAPRGGRSGPGHQEAGHRHSAVPRRAAGPPLRRPESAYSRRGTRDDRLPGPLPEQGRPYVRAPPVHRDV